MNKVKKITARAILCTFCLSLILSPQAKAVEGNFSDVPESHPFFQDISLLKQLGVVTGYEDGTFRPGNSVKRAAAIKIMYGLQKGELAAVTQAPFPDVPAGEWFAPFIAAAKSAGIVKGNPDGTYRPGSPVNKAAFITMRFAFFLMVL